MYACHKASYILHKNEQRIRLQFENSASINNLVKSIAGARWSKTYKSWHIPCDAKLYNVFKKILPALWQITETKTLTQPVPQQTKAVLPMAEITIPAKALQVKPKPAIANKITPQPVSQKNNDALQQYLQCLQLKTYSPSTIRTYQTEFLTLLQLLKNKDVSALTADDVKRYMLYCVNTLKLSENTLHSRINALKFYFEKVYPVGLKKIKADVLLCLCVIK